MRRCRLFHFAESALGVAAVVLMISTDVYHRTLEHFVSPFHTTRFQINVPREDDHVCIAWGGIERSELEVQI
ncbi:hypothetical protein D3C81_2267730 [compost metagenome]